MDLGHRGWCDRPVCPPDAASAGRLAAPAPEHAAHCRFGRCRGVPVAVRRASVPFPGADRHGVDMQVLSLPGLFGIDSLPASEAMPLVSVFNGDAAPRSLPAPTPRPQLPREIDAKCRRLRWQSGKPAARHRAGCPRWGCRSIVAAFVGAPRGGRRARIARFVGPICDAVGDPQAPSHQHGEWCGAGAGTLDTTFTNGGEQHEEWPR